MKVTTQKPAVFEPVHIVLESRNEVELMREVCLSSKKQLQDNHIDDAHQLQYDIWIELGKYIR